MANYNEMDIINIADTATAAKMFDKLTRIKDGRRIQPLDPLDNIVYKHRYLYDTYNLQIGDTYFMIPPEFIMVNSEATSQKIITLRQENTQKMKSGYHRRTILIDLIFNGLEQLNGYPVDGPEGTYYVDGLRQLLAQFKCTPFLPINNELINGMYGIFTVALQSIVISTVPGFPNTMTAQLTLQEVNMTAYLEMPDIAFKYMIDWDLFRFYYQRFLTEDHVYKKLQSLSPDKNHERFRLSILNNQVFTGTNASQSSMLRIVTDKKIVCTDESGNPATTNYVTWLDSEESDVSIVGFQCGYSNILTNIQLSEAPSPTVQFMGGMDTIYNITFETKDYGVVQAIEQCQISNDVMTRNNLKLRSVGFVKLESELVAFTGSLFVVIESVTTNTVPDFPGLYAVQMQCVAYDIGQGERENLNGFKPFDCDNNECKYNDFEPTHVHAEEAISQNWDGLKTKIKQDNYAEWKLRTNIEVYPDLHLPTYAETNEFISKCRKFRVANGLAQLPYSIYPTNPVGMLHGNNPKDTTLRGISSDIIYPSDYQATNMEYDLFVDPDFYVFYPHSYESFQAEDYNSYEVVQRDSVNKNIKEEIFIDTPMGSYASSDIVERFVQEALKYEGCTYKSDEDNGAGQTSDAKGPIFDCSGFVSYCMWQTDLMPRSRPRFVVSTLKQGLTSDPPLFIEVPYSERRRGDIVCKSDLSHCGIYLGDHNGSTDQVIHASNAQPYPKGGVKISTCVPAFGETGVCYRLAASVNQVSDSGLDASGVSSDLIDAVGKIISAQEGSYTSVSKNDSGALSIGKMQWHGNRAKNLLKTLCMSYPNLARTQLGEALYGEIMSNKSWSSRILTSGEKDKISSLLGTNEGKSAQDALARNDIAEYIAVAQSYGLTDPGAIAYFADGVNQYGTGSKSWKQIAEVALQNGGDVDAMYAAAKQVLTESFSKYESRRTAVYNAIKNDPIFNNGSTPSGPVLTKEEYLSICRIVQAETQGESEVDSGVEKAVAQVIYDMLTDPNKAFGGLGAILNSGKFAPPIEGAIASSVESSVKAVFCDNDKYWPDYRALDLLDQDEEMYATTENRNQQYEPLGMIASHAFWGIKKKGSDIKYTIIDSGGSGSTSWGSYEVETGVNYDAITLDATDAKRFGEPILVKTSKATSDAAFNRDEVNDTVNIFNTSFCDMYQYSARGRLVRAFPTYLFCVLDDQAQWYDGRKLWTNYYTHRSVVDIAVHGTNDMPTETATITITNSYHNLDQTQGGLSNYTIKNDPYYGDEKGFRKWFYSWSGLMIGGLTLTDQLIKLHQIIYKRAKLREGARIHLRMGYGSDPLSLAPVMNGHISDITLGDHISMIVTSDAHELIAHITSTNEKNGQDTNNGWLGLFGLGESQESSNIIAETMCKRQNWVNHLMGEFFEGSKYAIEHYGLYIRDDFLGEAFEFDGVRDQYDICKNIYIANYLGEPYCSQGFTLSDKEQNVVFNKYNMTPWDVYQVCTQQVPEYIVKSSYHQFDSRLYFGIPGWMEKYRYDIVGGVNSDGTVPTDSLYEEAKAAAQCHYLDPLTVIIDNQMRVSSKHSYTNIKVMYTEGSTVKPTEVLHSDDTIDFAYQKTTIMDSPIVQDAFGPDALLAALGLYGVGKDSAKRIGVSTLLYGWQQQYQGQIILMGCPGLKPNDYLMVNDTFSQVYGISVAREVVHSFNTMTGFTTSVTPGMIGFSTAQESGMIVQSQNLLMLLNAFSSMIMARKEMTDNYQHYLSIFANYEVMREKYAAAVRGTTIMTVFGWDITDKDLVSGLGAATTAMEWGRTAFAAAQIIKIVRAVKNVGGFVAAVNKAVNGIKTAMAAYKGFKAVYQGIKWGVSAAAGSVSFGVGTAISLIIFELVDWVISQVFEWLSNKNVVCLLPMWWQNYPFVTGVKDGEKILLIPSNATATDENDRGDAISLE